MHYTYASDIITVTITTLYITYRHARTYDTRTFGYILLSCTSGVCVFYDFGEISNGPSEAVFLVVNRSLHTNLYRGPSQ